MAISAAGIVFSNLNDNTLSRLTRDRTVAAIPFACRYRLVDFCLSNLVNANISKINVIVNYNYRSLVDHIGSGKDWDLARNKDGINVISPYQTATNGSAKVFSTHMEALKNIKEYIEEFTQEYVVLMDSDTVLNINLAEVIEAHKNTNAEITVVTKKIKEGFTAKHPRLLVSSQDGKISDAVMGASYNGKNEELCLNIFVMKTEHLKVMIEEAEAYGYNSFTGMLMEKYKVKNYRTYCYSGYSACVSSFLDYYKCSMELNTNPEALESLLMKKNAPIFTRIHNSAPVVYTKDANVENSMIADDCVIEGTVINSVLHRGVKVERGAVVKNSILFKGTIIKKNASVNCIVTDKDVVVSEGVNLSGNNNMPFYVQKGRRV